MATYIVSRTPDQNWNEEFKYKYRYSSQNGSPVAQDEVDRRRAAGEPAVLWRWEHGEPTLMERHNV